MNIKQFVLEKFLSFVCELNDKETLSNLFINYVNYEWICLQEKCLHYEKYYARMLKGFEFV